MLLGDRVFYTLDATDADKITAWRNNFQTHNTELATHKHPHAPGMPGATGHVAHIGVPVAEGTLCAADVTSVSDGLLGLRVLLNGSDVYCAWGVSEGTGPGHWQLRG